MKRGNDERMQCGAGLGVTGGVCLNSKSGADFILPRKRMKRGVGGMPERRSPTRARSLFHEHRAISALSGEVKKSGVTESMCCSSHMCSRGLLNAVIGLCSGSKPQHNNKARPSSFIILHVPGNTEKVKRPHCGTGCF